MELVILDENQVEIDKFGFPNNTWSYDSEKVDNIHDIDEGTKLLLDNLDYSVAVYAMAEDKNDFYASFYNSTILKMYHLNFDEIKGGLIFNTYLKYDHNNTIKNKINKAYNENQPTSFYCEYYHNEILHRRINVKFIRINDFLYILGKDETDYIALSREQENLFKNDFNASLVIQDGYIVKCNKKYLEVYEQDSYDDVIGQKLGYTGLNEDLLNRLNKFFDEIIEGKLFSHSIPVEIERNGKRVYSFEINGNYVLYNGKPAIMAVHHDITDEVINKEKAEKKAKEAKILQNNMEFIQSVTNTGTTYYVSGEYLHSSKLYEILEIEPSKEDTSRNILWDVITEKDKYLIQENYENLGIEQDNNDFIVTINTKNGNEKYLHCYIKVKIREDNFKDVAFFYQDVTSEQIYLRDLHNALDESLRLKDNLEKIQKISKTGMSYSSVDNYLNWSKPSFETLKLDLEKYKDYHGNFFELIIDEDKNNWLKAYSKCSPSHPEETCVQRIINGAGELCYIKCYVVCDYDINGKEIKHVNFYQDITEQIERENELKEALDNSLRLKKNFEKIQKISKTSMCYSNDKTDEDILWFSKGFNILDVNSADYYNTMAEYLIKEDKNKWIENHAKCTPEHPEISFVQRAITAKGNLVYIKTFVAYEFDEEGNSNSHVSFFQDITEDVERENRLKEALNETLRLNDNLDRIQAVSKTAMEYSENLNYAMWTPEIYNILEIDSKKYINNPHNIVENFIIDDDIKLRNDYINKLTPDNPDVEFTQRVKTGKGNIKYLKTVIHSDFNNKNELIGKLSFIQDITREMEYQNQLETALKDKGVLLSEVHHRVKNNLQIILSLISLNRNFESNPDTILSDTENRIYAMALIHEKIYGSNSLADVNIKEYVEALTESLLDMYWSNILFHSDMDSIDLNMEQAIPIGLIINELVTNTIKYAFPNDEEGNINISFKKEKNNYILIFKDDGVGLPEEFDIDNLSNLGLIVVKNLTTQIGGKLTILDCKGTGFKIEFKEE